MLAQLMRVFGLLLFARRISGGKWQAVGWYLGSKYIDKHDAYFCLIFVFIRLIPVLI